MLLPGPMNGEASVEAAGGQRPGVARPLAVAFGTTLLVTVLSYALPLAHSATGVGLAFLGVTYWMALRRDETTIRHHGLSLGGLLEPSPLDAKRLARGCLRALAYCAALCAIILPVFVLGFRAYWQVRPQFVFKLPASLFDDVLGQILVIALPEEAFYRGYLQTALDDALGTPWKVLGARVGWGLIIGASIFALGHVATELRPERLAVFFPALLFGWLRSKTGGIGAPLLLHAIFNLFAAMLARGYGMAT